MGMMGVMGMVDVQEEDKEEMGMIPCGYRTE